MNVRIFPHLQYSCSLRVDPRLRKTLSSREANLGPVVQIIVSLTSSLKGHLVKCFTTITNYTDIFCRKNEKSFCAKAFHIFSTKILAEK